MRELRKEMWHKEPGKHHEVEVFNYKIPVIWNAIIVSDDTYMFHQKPFDFQKWWGILNQPNYGIQLQ